LREGRRVEMRKGYGGMRKGGDVWDSEAGEREGR